MDWGYTGVLIIGALLLVFMLGVSIGGSIIQQNELNFQENNCDQKNYYWIKYSCYKQIENSNDFVKVNFIQSDKNIIEVIE